MQRADGHTAADRRGSAPAEALSGRLSLQTLLGAGVLAIGLLVVSRWFWGVGLRHYSGASA